jgi:hypothetical protein
MYTRCRGNIVLKSWGWVRHSRIRIHNPEKSLVVFLSNRFGQNCSTNFLTQILTLIQISKSVNLECRLSHSYKLIALLSDIKSLAVDEPYFGPLGHALGLTALRVSSPLLGSTFFHKYCTQQHFRGLLSQSTMLTSLSLSELNCSIGCLRNMLSPVLHCLTYLSLMDMCIPIRRKCDPFYGSDYLMNELCKWGKVAHELVVLRWEIYVRRTRWVRTCAMGTTLNLHMQKHCFPKLVILRIAANLDFNRILLSVDDFFKTLPSICVLNFVYFLDLKYAQQVKIKLPGYKCLILKPVESYETGISIYVSTLGCLQLDDANVLVIHAPWDWKGAELVSAALHILARFYYNY